MSTKTEEISLAAAMAEPETAAVDGGPAVTHATWLSTDVLFLITTPAGPGPGRMEAFAECGRSTVQIAARGLAYSPPSGAESSNHLAHAVLLRLPAGHTVADSLNLVLRMDGRTHRVQAPELVQATVGLDTLLRFELASLESVARADVLAFLVAGPGEAPTPKQGARRTSGSCCAKARAGQPSSFGRLQLSKSLYAARQALRERLPGGVTSVSAPQGLNIDAVLAVDDRNFYVQGWLHDEQAPLTRLTAVSPEGCRTEILPRLYRYRRPDVEQFYSDSPDAQTGMEHGWIVHLETPVPSLLTTGWMFEMGNAVGSEVEVAAPGVTRDLSMAREMILRDLDRERLPADRLRTDHVAPAMTRLEERRRSRATVESVDQHGQPPAEPFVSVVVPLYGRIDFLEHQLAQFVHDPEFQRADLIYVLDSPDLAEPFRTAAAQLAELYDVPFRAVVMSHNVGFSGVNNVGADLARGRLLLLLNSDVFPREPGWVSEMMNFYDATPAIGALAPKLLYEDDSIQHAGLYFRRLSDTGVWNNEHYYKGLHRNLPAANVARAVPAVTAACMMIDVALYRELGGLRGMYVQGDYEDSDLCLRLAETGRHSWYLPSVELYHLEGQSFPSQMRELTGDYNRWLHTSQRGATIQQVIGESQRSSTL
jgi:GT2 family glycosyltransferase